MPETLRIELDGRIPPGVTAKDIVLHLLALPKTKAGGGVGKVFEFTGEAVTHLSTDERTTLTNMTAELGGFTGIVAPDAETVRVLRERRGVDFAVEPWMRSDPGARYAESVRIDCSRLAPMVAAPGDPGNGVALSEVKERARVDIAYGGSCTAGKREDFDQYHAVLSWPPSAGCASIRTSSSTFSSARPQCATIASRKATSRPSSASVPNSCNPHAARAPVAGRDRPSQRTRSP